MKSHLLKIVAALFFSLLLKPLDACTLWAAAGEAVQGKGILIVKNRDWAPDHTQTLKMIDSPKGYKFIGLYAEGGKVPGLKAGVNEHGLVVTTATCGDISKEERGKMPRKKGLNRALLQQCKSVAEALSHPKWFKGPEFLLLADHREIALIEIGRHGKTVIQRKSQGTLFHTNHFIAPELQEPKPPENPSSHFRYDSIKTLLNKAQKPFSPNDFLTFSRNRDHGPDNSIFRTGSTPKKTRTLATFMVSMPIYEEPVLFLRLANPDQSEQEIELSLSAAFRGQIPALFEESNNAPTCSSSDELEAN